jgi:hypothetical protein
MSAETVTPGQVSAEDREATKPLATSGQMAPPPGSMRCSACHGPVLRFPSGLLRCVIEGVDVEAASTYVQEA